MNPTDIVLTIRDGSAVHRFGPDERIPRNLTRRTNAAIREGRATIRIVACAWCEDWAAGMDPEPCPRHDGAA